MQEKCLGSGKPYFLHCSGCTLRAHPPCTTNELKVKLQPFAFPEFYDLMSVVGGLPVNGSTDYNEHINGVS